MLLRHSHTSPFVRKVAVLLHETGLIERVEFETVDGWSEPDQLTIDARRVSRKVSDTARRDRIRPGEHCGV